MVPVVLSEVVGVGGQGGLRDLRQAPAGGPRLIRSILDRKRSNLPITVEQLQQVLGSDTVKQLAARFNTPVDQLTKVSA